MNTDSPLTQRASPVAPASAETSFVRTTLPWCVGGGGLLIYLLTLNHWISFSSLPFVSSISGWNWQVRWNEPLFWLVTYPFHWLSPGVVPLALNLFSAVCGALTLVLLSRSVALLPHDRTGQQRLRERGAYSLLTTRTAWVPPVIAAIVCGLQLTFWENATAISAEMFDVLLFAYVVRALLEYRLDGRDVWLYRAAVVYGAAMTNNYAMIGFFPLFIVSLIWLKRVGFFDFQFLSRMLLLGVLGLSFYLLLPLADAVTNPNSLGFWALLKANLTSQKTFLMTYVFRPAVLLHGDRPLWVLALPSLLPILALSVKWPSYFGDHSRLGVGLANFSFNVLYGVLLLVCGWVALDPRVSPRFYGFYLLPFYFLGALSVGYFTGYFLLVFGTKPSGRQRMAEPEFMPLVNGAVVGGVWLFIVGSTALLVLRNLPEMRLTNSPLLKRFATAMAESLPPQGAIVLSDDSYRLLLVQSLLDKPGSASSFMFLDTAALELPEYHYFLNRKYPNRWQKVPPKNQKVDPASLLKEVSNLGLSNSLYYLHPSFGYYFELFYPEPHGLVFRLKRYESNTLFPPPLTKEQISENEAFWKQISETSLATITAAVPPVDAPGPNTWVDQIAQKAHLIKDPNREALSIGLYYSRALNDWAVRLQQSGQLEAATARLKQAIELTPDNAVARLNLEYNRNLRDSRQTPIELSHSISDQLARYKTLDQAMNFFGPFDEPTFCYQQGDMFFQNSNYRQAAQQFARVAQLLPNDLQSRLRLAGLQVLRRDPEEGLKMANEIRGRATDLGVSRTNETELLAVETTAYLSKGDLVDAERAVSASLGRYAGDEEILSTATRIYMTFGYYSNALTVLDQHLSQHPDDVTALVNKGVACLRLKGYQEAVAPLTRVVDMGTNISTEVYYTALFNRAIAYLQIDKLDEAQRDYEDLQKALPAAFEVSYGLGEVAYRRHDTNAAVQNFQLYLSRAPTNMVDEISRVRGRLQELKVGSP